MKFGSLRVKLHLPFVFFSRHPILHEMVKDICAGLHGEEFKKRRLVFVFCGAHKKFALASVLWGTKLFIQTEQLCTEDGDALWGSKKTNVVKNIKENIRQSDVFLDINFNNQPFYKSIDINRLDKSKVYFGPYIFPRQIVDYKKEANNSVCFFGSLNNRRKKLTEEFCAKSGLHVEIVPEKTYGANLKKIVSESAAVLNIHYENGVYTESPRLLTVYLHGKVLISEKIGKPFQENVHYIGLEARNGIEYPQVFENFTQLVTQKFSFSEFIRRRVLNKKN